MGPICIKTDPAPTMIYDEVDLFLTQLFPLPTFILFSYRVHFPLPP